MAEMEDKDEFDEFGSVALMDYELSQAPTCIKETVLNNEDDCSTITKLQDRLCTMEGENKFLRSKNEKMDYQIRKIEDEKRRYLTEHEQQSLKQQEAFKADLVFKEKEILDLTQRCKRLEDRLTQQMTANTENGNIGNPRPLTCSNRINIDSQLPSRPLRKRTRPVSMEVTEQEEAKVRTPQVNAIESPTVSKSVHQNITVGLHSNAVLASKGGIDVVKHLIKARVIDRMMVSDSGYIGIFTTKREEGNGNGSGCEGSLNESISLESVLTANPFEVPPLTDNWESTPLPAKYHQDCFTSTNSCHGNLTSIDAPCFDSSVHILQSILSMHDSILHPHSGTNTSPCILQSLIDSFDSNVSFLNFIEHCISRYHTFIQTQSLPSTISNNRNAISTDEDSGSASASQNGRFDTDPSSYHTLTPLSTHLSPSSSDNTSSLGSSCSDYTASSSSQTAELKASLPNINIVLVFTILSLLAKYNPKARRDIIHAKSTEELSQIDFSSSGEVISGRKSQIVNEFTEYYVPSVENLSKHVTFNQASSSPSCSKSTISSLYSGNIFELLLQCLNVLATIGRSTHSKEKEILISILETLLALSEDCSMQILEKYSVLLKKEHNSLELLLRRDDSSIALHVLALLTSMSRSPTIVSMLCSNSRACILGNCYTLFCKPPSTENQVDTIRIWDQLIRFIGYILSTENGRKVLLESPCGCSLNLTKYLLECMMNIVHTMDKLKSTRTDTNISTLSNNVLLSMLNLVQMILHNRKQIEELKQDIINKQTCLYVVNTCFGWEKNKSPEEILQDIYQSIVVLPDTVNT